MLYFTATGYVCQKDNMKTKFKAEKYSCAEDKKCGYSSLHTSIPESVSALIILRRSTLFFSFTPFKKYVKKIRLRETPLEDSASGPLLPLGFLCRRPLVDLPDEVVENLQGHRQWHGQTEANMQNH